MQTNKGNSGGPVVNDSGELVAVVEGHHTVARSVSLYIDVSEVREFINETRELIDPTTIDQFVKRAENHYEAGRLDAALADMTQVLRLDSNHAYAMSSRGWIFYNQGDSQTALTEFNDAIAADRTMAYAYRGRAEVNYDLGDYEAAVADYTNAIKNTTDKDELAELYNDRGMCHFNESDFQAALQDFGRAVKANPNLAWAHANRGDALANLEEHQEALGAFQKAIEIDPQEPEFLWMMALSAQSLGNHIGAVKLLDIAINLDPERSDFLIAKAKSLAESGEMQGAVGLLSKAIELDGEGDRVYNEVGMVGFELGNFPLAQAQFRIAAEKDPENPIYWMNAGHASFKLKDLNAAARELTKSIQLDDGNADARALRGEVYSLLGRQQAAKRDYEKAEELIPDVFEKYSTKYLKIANRCPEPLTVMVRYHAQGADGKLHWYPSSGQPVLFEFEPGEVSTLRFKDVPVHGDQFYIWAEGKQSGKAYVDHQSNVWVAVGSAGYLSAIGQAEEEIYTFFDKQGSD